MARNTKHSYREPGSWERAEEAAYALADADTEDDTAYHRAKARHRAAVWALVDREVAHVLKQRHGRRHRSRPSMPDQPALPFRR